MAVPSIYGLKPRFQALLRPAAALLAGAGIRANHVTLFAMAASAGCGLLLVVQADAPQWFVVLPAFLFVRMALNAMDGMMAREFGQKSELGAYLNELGDVVSDAFVYLPFAYLPGFEPLWIGAVITLAVVSEMAGVLAQALGASRRYDGPMGKSDRAFVFGALAFWIGIGWPLSATAAAWIPRLIAALTAATIINRVSNGLKETRQK